MWLVDWLWERGREVSQKIEKHRRKKTEAEQKAELERWDRNHMKLIDGSCAVCNKPDCDPNEKCPGPVKKAP